MSKSMKSMLSVWLMLLLSGQAAAQGALGVADVDGRPNGLANGSAMAGMLAQAVAPQSTNQAGRGLTTTQKGALIGLGSGAGFGIFLGSIGECGLHCDISGYLRAAALFGGLGAGVGAIIGYVMEQAHKGSGGSSPTRTTIVAPIVSTERQGIMVSVRFGS